MRGMLGKSNPRKCNLRKSKLTKNNLWKFNRKLAVILAVLLVLQSMPIKAEQNGQGYANGTDTEEGAVQEEGGSGASGEGGSEGDGSETGGNEGDGSGEGGNEGEESEILELEFEFPEPEPQVYTVGKFINTVHGKGGAELSDVTVKYSIEDTGIASINSDTGEVTFLKAGTVKITAEVTKKISTKGEPTEGEPAEGEPTEGGTTEGGTTEGGTTEGESTEGGTTEGEPTEGGTTEGGTTEGGTMEGEPTEGEPAEGGTTEGGTTEGESTEGEPAEGESTEGEPAEGESTEGGSAEGEPTEGEPTEGGTTEGGTTEGESTEGEPAEGGTTEGTTTEEDEIIITSISYTLVIEKAPQTIAFDETDPDIRYGQRFSNSAKEVVEATAFDGIGYGKGEIVYQLVSGGDIASVDQAGNLTFQDGMTGAVTVEAVKKEDDCYKQSAAIQYTVAVTYEQTPVEPYTLLGTQEQETEFEGWYSSKVTIRPHPDYLISNNNSLTNTEWRDSIVLEGDGTHDSIIIYLKNKNTDAITDAIQVEVIQIDQTAPVDLRISYDKPLIEKIKESVTFGFYKAKLEITLKAKDELSGVSSFTYWLNKTASGEGTVMEPENGVVVEAKKGEDGFYYGTFYIEQQFKGSVIFTATDGAGNTAGNITSNGIVIDDKPSKLSVAYSIPYVRASFVDKPGVPMENYEVGTRTDVNLFYADSLTLDFTIEEENFFKEDVKIEVNGKVPAESLTWEKNEDGNYSASLPLKDEGAYVVTLSYEDPSQNGKVEYTSEHIIIDTTKPVLDVAYKTSYVRAASVDAPSVWLNNYKERSRTDVILYYAGNVELDFTITEQNFYEEDVKIEVNGKAPAKSLTWTKNADGNYSASLTLEGEDEYVVSLSYEDPSQKGKVEYTSEHIIIDTTSPVLRVDYKNQYVRASSVDKPGVPMEDYEVGTRTDVNLFYADSLTLDFTIEEENFFKEDVKIEVNGKAPKEILTWTRNADGNYSASLPLEGEGAYVVTLSYEDPSQNGKVEYTSEHIIIDTTKPVLDVAYKTSYVRAASVDAPSVRLNNYKERSRTDVNLYYAGKVVLDFTITEQNFYKEDVKVKVNGEDRTLRWTSKGNGIHGASLELNGEGEYVVTLSYEDPSQNGKVEYTSEHIIIDTTQPKLKVDYGSRYVKASSVKAPGVSLKNYKEKSQTDINLYYDNGLTLNFAIEEKNFFKEDVKVEVNGKPQTLTWEPKEDGSPYHTASLNLTDEGAYVVTLRYQDPSGNEEAKYTSEHIILDNSDPKIQVTYDVTEPVTGTSDIFNQTRTATIKITDKNIYPNDGGAVSVKITAKDALGANVDFTPNCQFIKTPKKTDDNPDEPDEWKAVISYDVSANYTFKIDIEDMAGHKAFYGTDSFTVDITKPDASKFSINYSKDYKNWFEKMLGTISFGYYRPSVTITFKAEDETTSIVGMEWIYTRRNEESTAEPENVTGIITENQLKRVGNQVIAEITLTAEEAAQYRGNIAFKAIDKAGNESYYRTDQDNVIVVDTIAPTRTVYYSPAKQVTEKASGNTMKEYGEQTGNKKENLIEGIGAVLYYDNAMTLTLEMREANFYAEDVKVYVYRDGKLLKNGDGYNYDAKSNWITSEKDINEHKMTLQLGTGNVDGSRDGDYVVVISYSDRSGNEMPVYTSEQITIDTRKPVLGLAFPENAVIRDGIVYLNENPSLEVLVSEHNFRAGEVSVIVTAKDAYGNEIPVRAGKDANGKDVTYAQYLSDAANWTSVGDEHRASVLLEEDARYEFVVSYYDLAMQKTQESARCIIMVDRKPSAWEKLPYDKAYSGNLARMVDGRNQQVEQAKDANQDTRFIFQGEVTLTIGLIEDNFFPNDVEVVVERDGVLLESGTDYHYDPQDWTVDSEDSTHHILNLVLGEENVDHSADGDYRVRLSYTDTSGNVSKQYLSNVLTIDTTVPVIYVEYDNNEPHAEAFYGSSRTAVITVTDRNIRTDEIDIHILGKDTWGNELETVAAKIGNWVPGEKEGSWENTITYDMDANYDIEILCPDMAGNQSLFTDGFTIDKELPSLRYEYSSSLMETALNFITFGYYQPDVTVTVYAQDDIAGVDYLIWGYEKEAGSSSVNVENRGGTIHRSDFTFETTEYGVEARASVRLTANEAEQYRGRITFEVADRAGNIKRETDEGKIIVVDTISPTRTVSYSPAVQVADRQTGNIITNYTYEEGADTILYYDGPMEIAFRINEANFYAEDMVFKVNDQVVQVSNWENNGDNWSGSLSLYEDGDYIVTMEYTDRSGNGMAAYTSSQITIDTIVPRIETNWATERQIQTKENINYSQEDMEVTIVIHERNFRAQDVEAVVTAVDAAGLDVPVEDYTSYLRDAQNWTRDGDLQTAVLNFPTDANYTFTIQFQDLVFHSSEEYEPYAFTVDKTPPTDMTIDYSTPVLESILNAITFGFYNAHSTVTITAVDDTSGVEHFIYSFLRANDVSNVNTELINAQIEESDIVYSEGRKIATATFRIPNSELGENTQFNGTVEFSAVDRTQLETKFVDGKRVIVDTIAPVAEVQYNEPVSMDGDTSYYDGTIEGVINVTEANFYAEDVNLFVSKDGGAFEALTPTWTLLGMDRNAGAFTLTGDGEYIVSAVYTDRSTNQMVEYQSDLLVIDTEDPQITVSGIRNRSANRDETIGFVVTVRDENLDPASCHPKLMAEVCDDVNGGTVFREIDMLDAGTTNTVHNGGEYVYTYVVENLDRDGIYTLSCEAADRAGHSVTEVTVENSQNGRPGQDTEQVTEQVMFSVNRNGSTYSLNQESRNIIGTFAKAPIDIVVTEINPDILNVIRITLFRDEKTLVLQEGTDYRIDRTGGDGEWNSYVYTIFAENFENDGVYRISVYSEDEAENVAENTLDNKNLEISFGIDKTLPNLIVTNLESGRTYNEDSHTVNMQANDNMRLVSVEVWLDGEAHMSWEEEEILRKMMEYEDYSFVISGESTRAHDVTVALTDAAGNRLVEEISDFYVTTNFWLILWRRILDNKPLLFGTMAGVTGVVAIPVGIVALRRRRKSKSNAGA